MVAHDDVRQLHSNNRGNGFLVGQAIDKPLADQDRVADRGGLDGGREQNAGAHLVGEGKIVRNLEVDDDLIEHGVFIAARSQRRHQAGFHQPVDHVVLGLRDPGARGLQRPHIGRIIALVDRVVDFDADVLALTRGQLERVAPEVRLRLQPVKLLVFAAVRLFNVDGYRQPDSRLHVHPPTVEVVVVARVFLGAGAGISAVKADDVAILVFDPDAAEEAAHACNLGMHIVDPGAHRTQELTPHIAEDVVLVVEALRVQEHHLGKAERVGGEVLVQPERLGQPGHGGQRTLEEVVLGRVARHVGSVKEALAEVDAAQHVLVGDRHLIELLVRLRVLNIGLHQRRALLNVLDQHLFAADSPLHQGSLLLRELVRLGELGFLLFRIRAGDAEGNKQEGEGDLPKRHVRLLSCVLSSLLLAACTVPASCD